MSEKKKDTQQVLVGITTTREESFSNWYTQTIIKAEMIEYYDVSGCYVLRPTSMSIWNSIKDFLNKKFQSIGVEEVYFPLFVTKTALEKEQSHIEGFQAEVAWITKTGTTNLQEHIAIRPTSETVMYPFFSKWINSHRDLPLQLNQWCNVVRWEFSHPQPFLRSREFLWQEGHSVFETKEESDKNVLQILEFYRMAYEETLAIPVIKGKKSENEKFAGSLYTTTVEAIIPGTGKAIQAATSHCLGQEFSKMFEVIYDDNKLCWQTSWGFTTRSIGVMIMIHGDNKGLVLPPRVAPIQVIIIPCGINKKTTDEARSKILEVISELENRLIEIGIRAKSDLRDNVTVGYKFNQWELKGVPLRVEIGPRDVESKQMKVVKRYNKESEIVCMDNIKEISGTLDLVHKGMFDKAKEGQSSMIKEITDVKEILLKENKDKVFVGPWCEGKKCEENIKKATCIVEGSMEIVTGVKSLCIPFNINDLNIEDGLKEGIKCFGCDQKAIGYGMFGRSY